MPPDLCIIVCIQCTFYVVVKNVSAENKLSTENLCCDISHACLLLNTQPMYKTYHVANARGLVKALTLYFEVKDTFPAQ